MSERVDTAIDKAEGQIRDRSDFGTKAIKFYLDYIENIQSEDEIILEALLSLANHVGVKGIEIEEIQTILKDRIMIPSVLSSNKLPESHPDFDKLLGLLDQVRDEEMYNELSNELRDVAYEDISGLYKTYSEAFFLRSSGKAKQKAKH